jgi:hypothetical protein
MDNNHNDVNRFDDLGKRFYPWLLPPRGEELLKEIKMDSPVAAGE